jgi:CSLREA domain-containing protein
MTVYTYDRREPEDDRRAGKPSFAYDLLNRLLSTTDPLTHTTQYAYDAVGDVITMTDALARNTVSTYDLLNRLTKIDYPAPDADVLFTYDGAGQRTVMTDSVGTTTWNYDLVGRPLTITQPFTGSVVYGYDSAGNRLSLKYPDGKVVTDTYDLASRLVQVKDWQTQTTSYAYDSASRLTSLALPNGITSTYTYDGANRLLALTHQTLTQTVASYTYTLDAVGNRVQVVESGPQAAAPPSGNVITVTTTTDELNTDGDCALREAVRAANLNTAVDACPAGSTSPDTIIVPSGTYTLTRTGSADNTAVNGDLDITGTVTLNGAGANLTIITGNTGWNERIFHVLNTTAELSGVTIRNGSSGSNSGAGLRNEGGVVTLSYSAVISNTASGDDGGGLHNTSGGTLTLLSSTVMSNTTGLGFKGGGIYNQNAGTLTLVASAVAEQHRGDSGGGVQQRGR